MTAPDLKKFKVLTFDCYGTLIDWESGILEALEQLRSKSERMLSDEQILEQYALVESNGQAGVYKRYREVLRNVATEMASFLGVDVDPQENDMLANSIEHWMPFPDTIDALRHLKTRFQLAIVSNIDDDLFAHSARHLEVPFDLVVTAEQVQSYKPSHNNFLRAIERIGVPRDEILHVAQSLYHDIKPANELGLANVWINRRGGKHGFGATQPAEATPSLEVPDLATLAALARMC
jgi:2-haloacid dehalogenase